MAVSNATVWRTFKFFDQEQVKNGAPVEESETTAAACGRNLIYLGDALGSIRVIERQSMTPYGSFQAYSKIVTHIRVVKSTSVKASLVTIGDDDASEVAIIRIWDTDRSRPSGGAAATTTTETQMDVRVIREIKLFPKGPTVTLKPIRVNYNADLKMTFRGPSETELGTAGTLLSPVVCFDITDDLQHIAVGLTDSQICIVRGDLHLERGAVKMQNISTKHASGDLTFVGFPRTGKESSQAKEAAQQQGSGYSTLLFAVYEDVTVAFPLPARGRDLSNIDSRPFDIPSRVGADPECSVISDDGELFVADRASNNIVVYGGEQFMNEKRLKWDGAFGTTGDPMPPIEGEKRKLAWHKHYFVLLMRLEPRKPEKFTFGIFDRDSRIRAVSMPQSTINNPAWILSDVSDVMVVWSDSKSDRIKHKVCKYAEITKQAKFDLLFRKDMYEEAKRIAKQLANSGSSRSEDAEFDIAKRYGDHLYDKGKYEEAVQQYIEAIRTTEPSYVIRKFLGEQRIANLTTYLEALHRTEHGKLANRNHTTLLLNCYAKLKNERAMDEFIRREDITFDAANAIHVCRQAGYYEAAIFLAEKYEKPDEYVKILLENLNAYQRAVDYIGTLHLADAERILKAHGKAILTHLVPHIGKDLHVRLCTAWVPSGAKSARLTGTPPFSASPEDYMASFVDTPRALMQFLEAVVLGTYQRPSISAVARPGTFDPRTSEVLGTLLELYLTPELPERVRHRSAEPIAAAPGAAATGTTSTAVAAGDDRLDKAYTLLTDYTTMYDPFHALMLSQQYGFERGVVYLLGWLGLHSEIFVYYAKQLESAKTHEAREKAKTELRKACLEGERKNPGDGSRDMWVSMLSLLVRSQDDVEEEITQLLDRIEQNDLLPPVAVIEILAANQKLELKAVRSYVIKMIKRDQAVIESSQREIDEMSAATNKLQQDVMTLQTTAQVFQISKCQQCEQTMEPPAVYFLCNHAFHERCLAERKECNICGQNHRRHVQTQKEFDSAADKHEQFFELLSQARKDADGFSIVAEQFGKGIFATKWSRAAGDLTAAANKGDGMDEDFDDVDLYSRPLEETTELETW